MEFFNELGSLVEHRWKDEDYNEEVFPAIAERALHKTAPYLKVDPWEIIRWVNTTDQLPQQQDLPGMFGKPPITVFNGPRFYIDVYYWLDGTTSIHQHGFCGAFQVLLGSSLHSQYSFDNERRINSHFSVGQVNLRSVDLLEVGGVRQILPGRQYIHSLFHLDRPSATIVIRTQLTPDCMPQYDYRKPYFALDPFYSSPTMIKRVQSASLLLGMKHANADDLIGDLLSRSDFQTAFAILDLAYGHLVGDRLERAFGLTTGEERFQSYLDLARRRHGELADLIIPVFEEIQRQQNIIYRRGQITSNEHRFFLALLLNVPDRVKLLDLVRQRFPDQSPVETILDWIDELANTKVIGSAEQNVLAINHYDDDYLFVFQCLLEGLTFEQTKSAYAEEFSVDVAEIPIDKLEDLYNSIRNSMIFKSIFLDSVLVARDKIAAAI